MENTVITQLYSLIIYVVSGIVIGIFFDIFRVLRKSFKTPDIITYIEDTLFWLFTGAFLIFVLFKFNNGEIRSYVIIGLFLGILLYMLTISKHFIKINVAIITFIKNIFIKIFNIIFAPIKAILKILKRFIIKPFTFFVINLRKNVTKCYSKIPKNNKNTKKTKKMLGKEGF